MAIIAPGIFLSQPPIATSPSIACPRQTVSIESAMTSREMSEYFIPGVPIEMPSLIVMVPKTCGIMPMRLPSLTATFVRSPRLRLHGVIVL